MREGITIDSGSPVPPSGAHPGDLWFDPGSSEMYMYFESKWVQIGVGGETREAPRPDPGAALLYEDELEKEKGNET